MTMTRFRLWKAEPRDADGDGRVYDGTPRERPALPSETKSQRAVLRAAGLLDRKGGKKKVSRDSSKPRKPDQPDGPKKPKTPTAPKGKGGVKPNSKPPKKTAAKPSGGVTDKWKINHSGRERVGATVHTADANGEVHTFHVVGVDADDVRAEIESIKNEGHVIRDIKPPRKRVKDLKDQARKPKPTPEQVEAADKPDAPDPTGPGSKSKRDVPEDIFAALEADDEGRFQRVGKSGGSGDSQVYVDTSDDTGNEVTLPDGRKTTNRVYYVKTSAEQDGDLNLWDESMNEVVVTDIMRGMGWNLPEVQQQGDWGKGSRILQGDSFQHTGAKRTAPTSLVRESVMDRVALSLDKKGEVGDDEHEKAWMELFLEHDQGLIKTLQASDDKSQMLRIALTDFLVLNQDRHLGNWGVDSDTGNVTPYDHGFSMSGGIDTYNDAVGDDFVPGTLDEWLNFRGFADNFAAMSMALGVLAVSGDRKQVRSAIKQVIDDAAKVDVDAILERLAAQGLSGERLQVAKENMADFQNRIAWLAANADQVARRLTS